MQFVTSVVLYEKNLQCLSSFQIFNNHAVVVCVIVFVDFLAGCCTCLDLSLRNFSEAFIPYLHDMASNGLPLLLLLTIQPQPSLLFSSKLGMLEMKPHERKKRV
jgi:hypothetical protein